MVLTQREEKERAQRERQLIAIREYNRRKKSVYDARLAKFLKLYPYFDKSAYSSLDKFYRTVHAADFDKLNTFIESFNEENAYWNTYYVLKNCNNNIHNHIIAVLNKMHESLALRINDVDFEEEEEDDKSESYVNSWGKKGEREVDYVLKWLTDEYVMIEKDCNSKYGGDCILLENARFIDEDQEYDHIVIGPQGIFVIETKNYSGKLYIDNAGNWMRMKKGESDWSSEINPTQQVNRHHVLLESIVGSNVPIIDVICLAHPDLMVAGQENSKITVVKKDLLGDFVMNYPGKVLTPDEIEAIEHQIDLRKVNN